MVCKEDVVSWFKGLKSHTRIDVMCNLFNLCLPFELRFLGTCLEDLGKRDFHDLRTTETGANNPSELSSPDLQCISDKRARTKLALYISLLHSCNYACSNGYYRILANVEEVNNLIKCNGVSSTDDDVLEELLLIYTLALNHPAFTFEQKLFLGEVFTKLQLEEEKRHCMKRTRAVQGSPGMDAIDKLPLQTYQPCASPDQITLPPPTSTARCSPMTPAALTGDPLMSLSDPLMGYLPYSLMGYHPAVMMPPPPPAEQRSPLVSRTSSPCQSNSPSRTCSPPGPKPALATFTRPPPVVDPSPPPVHSASKFTTSMEQLRRMTDEELRDQGFNSQSICQFRTLETKMQATNGFNLAGKKLPTPTTEPDHLADVTGVALKRYNSAEGPLNPPPLYYPPCLTCVVRNPQYCHATKSASLPPHVAASLQRLSLTASTSPHADIAPSHSHSLDSGSLHNSSTSDSASDHSPPDTPHTDRGPLPGAMEAWEEPRIPELSDERRMMGAGAGHGRGRGSGRGNRSNPPGIQTLPRGRGHNPTHRRRDMNSSNGSLEGKVFSGSDSCSVGGAGVAYPYGAPLFPPNHFIHFPSFTSQGGVFRLPFHPNGEMLYHAALPPPTGQPFLATRPVPPTHLPFSPLVPPPKISCYNCGSQNHIGTDCPEATIEEITKKGQYRIDYTNNLYPKPGECSTQDK